MCHIDITTKGVTSCSYYRLGCHYQVNHHISRLSFNICNYDTTGQFDLAWTKVLDQQTGIAIQKMNG